MMFDQRVHNIPVLHFAISTCRNYFGILPISPISAISTCQIISAIFSNPMTMANCQNIFAFFDMSKFTIFDRHLYLQWSISLTEIHPILSPSLHVMYVLLVMKNMVDIFIKGLG